MVVVLFLGVILVDYRHVAKGRKDQVFYIYTLFLTASFVMMLLRELSVKLPDITLPLTHLIRDVLGLK